QGGNAAATRAPSGNLASSEGFDSPISFHSERAIRLTALARYFGSSAAFTDNPSPFRCMKIAPSPLTITSESPASTMRWAIGCKKGRMVSRDMVRYTEMEYVVICSGDKAVAF